MANQLSMFGAAPSVADAEQARDTALEKVERGADPVWLAEARAKVLLVARTHDRFTGDDIWAAGLSKGREPRALGAVMNALAREGEIVRTGSYVKSRFRHASPMVEWRHR